MSACNYENSTIAGYSYRLHFMGRSYGSDNNHNIIDAQIHLLYAIHNNRKVPFAYLVIHQRKDPTVAMHLLVEGLGVGGSGRNVGIAGSLVRAGGELELVGSLEVGVAGLAVGAGVILEVEKLADHLHTAAGQTQ